MNTLRIIVPVTTLVGLQHFSNGTYPVDIYPLDTNGNALGNSNIPALTNLNAIPVGNVFTLDVPIVDGNYSIPNARFLVRFYSDSAVYPGVSTFPVYKDYPINNVLSSGTLPDSDTVERGVRITVRNNRKFKYINGETTGFEILANGNVKLNFVAKKRSFNNDNDVVAIVMDGNFVDMTVGDNAPFFNALKSSSGLTIPPKVKRQWIYCYYGNPKFGSTEQDFLNNFWEAFGNPATYGSNSYRTDHCMIQIVK